MNYYIILFFTFLFCGYCLLSQDTLNIDNLNYEESFEDSILRINKINNQIKNSQEAYNQGVDFFNQNDYEKAILSFDKAILLDTSFFDAYFLRYKSYYFLEQYIAGINDLTKMLDFGKKKRYFIL